MPDGVNKATMIGTLTLFAISINLFHFVTVAHCYVERRPNIIFFLADDLGYGDLSVYGHPSQEWGPVDVMARDGLRFTHWYAADNVCTPSRVALLTGRYPFRSGMVPGQKQSGARTGSKRWTRVILETASTGLPKEDITMAEALKGAGYATGMVGKWHLGINAFNSSDGAHLPHHHGFDYVGTNLPWTAIQACTEDYGRPRRARCFLYKNKTIIQQPIDLSTLTNKFVQDAKEFISSNKDHPFFLFFSFVHPHVPMFSNEKFQNSSKRGRYGDNVNEMSWAVGEVLQHIRDLHLDQDTLAIFTSDHGPATEFCNHGGSSGVLKGGKWFGTEGGYRVPMIAWWPGTIQPGIQHNVGNHMDFLPTFINITGGTLPKKSLDGVNRVKSLLSNKQETDTDDTIYFYVGDKLHSARYKSFKIYYYTCGEISEHYFEKYCKNGEPNTFKRDVGCGKVMTRMDPPLMFNVDVDPGERFSLRGGEYDIILQEVDTLVATKKGREWDRVSPHLLPELRHPSLAPCCNPPYCLCNYK